MQKQAQIKRISTHQASLEYLPTRQTKAKRKPSAHKQAEHPTRVKPEKPTDRHKSLSRTRQDQKTPGDRKSKSQYQTHAVDNKRYETEAMYFTKHTMKPEHDEFERASSRDQLRSIDSGSQQLQVNNYLAGWEDKPRKEHTTVSTSQNSNLVTYKGEEPYLVTDKKGRLNSLPGQPSLYNTMKHQTTKSQQIVPVPQVEKVRKSH